ncbi:MAG: hypothetical protein B6I20_01630 [Bacteroidetes bacterium 4572_117]|nr:MAG: hypothetical protein B6I20_01630 [Bacteroidetes bacterium 4572_117]
MKKLFGSLVTVFIVIFMVSMNSCDEDGVLVLPSMKATVDGSQWTSLFRATIVDQTAGSESIIITGTPTVSETADKTIVITVNGIAARTYKLSVAEGRTECLIAYKKTANAADGSDDYYVSLDATVTITKIDFEKKQVSGSFSATLYPNGNILQTKMEIRSGTFENLNFQ